MERFADATDRAAIEAVPLESRLDRTTVQAVFAEAARRWPDAPAIVWLENGRADDDPRTVTYGQLQREIVQAANLLHDVGVRPDWAVSLLLPNLPETHFAIWGGSLAGVANPINPLLTPEQIAEIMAAAGSRTLITGGPDKAYGVHDKARAVRALYPDLDTVIVIGEGDEGSTSFEARRRYPADRLISGRLIESDDPSVYFHTGGTTGAPKLAQQTHANQVFTAWSSSFAMGLSPADTILTGLPLFHANAAITTGLSAFFSGATVLLCGQQGYRDKAMMADFWRTASRFSATIISGVPTLYARLLDDLPDDLDTSALRLGLCGAAPMPVSLFQAFEARTGLRILEGYGMTEGGAISTCNPRDGERRIGSIGLALPYQDVRPVVLDEEGGYVRDCQVDEVGALLLSGPNIFPGYRQERFNKGTRPLPGWFNSGDLGRRDADGFFWLAGRAKDLIIRGGHNIDPAIIEEALHQHPEVELAAAVGMPDCRLGELPVAFVKRVTGSEVGADDLQAFAKDRVADPVAAPIAIYFVETMPVTAVGKIFKPTLRLAAARSAIERVIADRAGATIDVYLDDRLGLVASVTIGGEAPDGVAAELEALPLHLEVIRR